VSDSTRPGPRVNADDEAISRRILQIPFTVVIPPDERDPELKRALRSDATEQSAILTWLVQGCRTSLSARDPRVSAARQQIVDDVDGEVVPLDMPRSLTKTCVHSSRILRLQLRESARLRASRRATESAVRS
jgi:putative DNA primase/helicase